MKKTILLLPTIAVLLVLAACTDSADIGQLGSGANRLVVYAFPSDGDTVSICVSQVLPVSGQWQPLHVSRVECRTNGVADRVVSLGDTVYQGFTIARFMAVGRHCCGDSIDIAVSADGLPGASGRTVIPGRPQLGAQRLDTAVFRGAEYPVLRAEMCGNATTPYYAVRAEALYSDAYRAEAGAGLGPLPAAFVPLNIEAEPLFAGSSKADIDLGTIDNDFYGCLYTFDNTAFGDATATLHLYIDGLTSIYSAYRPCVLALSAEYNAMLRSLNGNGNNDFGRYGLAFVYSSYTNVRGGYGCIGGYAAACGTWQR